MCCVGKECSCVALKTATWCSCLWARGVYGLKGLKRQGLLWLEGSSSQGIKTRPQKAAVSRFCQAVAAFAENRSKLERTDSAEQGLPGCLLRRCGSLASTLLAMARASSPCSWFDAIWVCVVTDGSIQLKHAAPRTICVESFSLALHSLATFSYVIFPAPSFTAEKCQTSSRVIRVRNSSSSLPNRLRAENPLKINALYQQQNCCCRKKVTCIYWVWWVPLSWLPTCGGSAAH